MKFRVTMKDPDTLHDSVRDAVHDDVVKLGLPTEEADAIEEIRRAAISDLCATKWFRYGEYLTVEIDTESKTCVVVPNS